MKSKLRAEIAQRFLKSYRLLYVEGAVNSKKEFCERIKLQPQNFSQIEQGRLSCTIDNIYNLAETFGVSLNWLFFESGDFIVAKDR